LVCSSDLIIDALKERFPNVVGPPKADICYATSNRQAAVRAISSKADLILVVGDSESANSTRLADIARGYDKPAYLISSSEVIESEWLEGVETVLLTSGASVPEKLVQEVIQRLQEHEPSEVEEAMLVEEDVHFRLPANIS
ncbi:MAG: 4-hydroxy-3-methylbut-2-enyl diphosphate reductase, partial [Candidatus Hydrogenedentota bacterium]